MNEIATPDPFGTLVEPATLRIERLLPGPIERCWAYLTDDALRRRWLAAGEMEMLVGAQFELVWRHDELSEVPSVRPPEFGPEHRMTSRVIDVDPPRRLTFTWSTAGEVTFDLEPVGAKVLLTVTHRRIASPAELRNVRSGWHTHLDILVADIEGMARPPFWETWAQIREEYDRRLPA